MAVLTKNSGKVIIIGLVIVAAIGLVIYRSHLESPPSCISADQTASNEDQKGCVQFVGYADTSSRGSMYLDQSTTPPYGFSVYIPSGTSFGPSLLNEYSGKKVNVTGTITNYRGEPEIVISDPSQIQLAQ